MMLQHKPGILLFIDWYAPGFKAGGPIISCVNMIAQLRDYFDFFVVTRNTDYLDDIPYTDIDANKWIKQEGGVEVYYLSKDNINKRSILQCMDAHNFDYVFINGVFSLYFSFLPLKLAKKRSIPVVLAPRGMLAPGALGIKPLRKYIYLSLARFTGLYRGVRFQATGQHEAAHIRKCISPDAEIIVAPNLAKPVSDDAPVIREKKPGTLRIVNIARIAPEKNLLFALDVLHQVKAEVQMDIYGPVYDKVYWHSCKMMMESLPENVHVKYNGSIKPGAIPCVLQQNHLMFMPTLGENYGHVIAEALAEGCPVLISDRTPWEGSGMESGVWALSLDNKKGYLDALNVCIALEQDEFNALSQNAKRTAKRICMDPCILEQNRRLFVNT